MAIVRYAPLPLRGTWLSRPTPVGVDRLFNRFFEDAFAPRIAGHRRPGIAGNVYDSGKAFLVELPVPGVKPEDLGVTVHENVLTVKAKRTWSAPEGAQALWRGFGDGEWEQSFTLPGEVNAEQVEAHLEHGILRLELPKADHVLPRSIKISTNGTSAGTPAEAPAETAPAATS
jgi:HSP20 family protein